GRAARRGGGGGRAGGGGGAGGRRGGVGGGRAGGGGGGGAGGGGGGAAVLPPRGATRGARASPGRRSRPARAGRGTDPRVRGSPMPGAVPGGGLRTWGSGRTSDCARGACRLLRTRRPLPPSFLGPPDGPRRARGGRPRRMGCKP